jgi:hypothetical protein
MTITHKMDFYIEDLPEDKADEFLDRFIALVEEFNCTCAGGFLPYKEDEDEQTKVS